MGLTDNFDIPYPELDDIPDGAGQMKALADRVDTILDAELPTPSSVPIYDECDDLDNWTQFQTAGTVAVQTVADSSVGGKVFRFTGHVGLIRNQLVPYDPNALYRIKFRVRQTVDAAAAAPAGAFYAGYEGVAADGVTLVNINGANQHPSQHFMACAGTKLLAANGWQEWIGYAKGVAATGTATVTPSPTEPGKMHQNVRYIRPYLQINYTAADGVAEIDYVSLEIVPEVFSVPSLPVIDECGDLTQWTQHSGAGIVTVQTPADSAVGGKVFRVSGYAIMSRTGSLIPFDPNALYRVKFRVRQTVDDPGKTMLFAGLSGVAADGVTLVNIAGANSFSSQHHVAAQSRILTVAGGWQERVGYVKGVAATGTGSEAGSPTAPGQMHQNVRYIRPEFQINYNGGVGVAEIDYVSVEIVPNDALIAVGDTAEVDLTNTAGTVTAALTGTRNGNMNVSGEVVAVNNRFRTVSGNVESGDVATTYNGWGFKVRGLVASVATEGYWYLASGESRLALYEGGAETARLTMRGDGIMAHAFGGVSRPLAFAICSGTVTISLSASASGSAVFTYPAGRFTQSPLVVCTTAALNYFASTVANSTSQITIQTRHADGTAATTSVGVNLIGVQMTPTASVGLTIEDQPPVTRLATCHESSCVNQDVEIGIFDPDLPVWCGGCGQEITDIEPVTS